MSYGTIDHKQRQALVCCLLEGWAAIFDQLQHRAGESRRTDEPPSLLAPDGKRGLASVESYILGRYYMYIHVYYHKTIRAAETMLRNLLKEVIKSTAEGFEPVPRAFAKYAAGKIPDLDEYLELNDFQLLNLLDTWSGKEVSCIQDLSQRLVERRIFATLVVPDGLAYDKRQAREHKAKTLLRDKKLRSDSDMHKQVFEEAVRLAKQYFGIDCELPAAVC